MRIAIFHNLPSGGGKRALHELMSRMTQMHEMDVFTLSCAEHDFCDVRPFANKHVVQPFTQWPLLNRPFGRLNQLVYASNILRVSRLQREVATQIDAGGYDVVFVHHCRYAQGPAVLSFLRTPSAYYCAEPPRVFTEPLSFRLHQQTQNIRRKLDQLDPLIPVHRNIMLSLDRKNTHAATTVLTNSAFSRESLYHYYRLFAQVCYLGVDSEKFRPLGLPKENYILSVGAIAPPKGHDAVIRGLAQIDPTRRPLLILAGSQNNAKENVFLQSLADSLGVRIEFRTQVSDDALVRLYNQALFTVCTPIMEPFGFVPIESMACGTAVIGVREGGVRETVIHEQTGLLVDRAGNQLTLAMQCLLDDAAKREAYGQRGREVALAQWSWDKSVRQLDAQLRETAQQTHTAQKTSRHQGGK
jgi:glycosyltransferase involved in cell wall biosynthesis